MVRNQTKLLKYYPDFYETIETYILILAFLTKPSNLLLPLVFSLTTHYIIHYYLCYAMQFNIVISLQRLELATFMSVARPNSGEPELNVILFLAISKLNVIKLDA